MEKVEFELKDGCTFFIRREAKQGIPVKATDMSREAQRKAHVNLDHSE